MAKEVFRESRAMAANIDYIARRFDLSRKKLSGIMKIGESTLQRRMLNPEGFHLEELELLAAWATKRGFPVTLAQICKPFVPARIDAAEVSA